MQRRKILTFLGFLSALAAVAIVIPEAVLPEDSPFKVLAQLFGYFWAPALAVILTEKWIFKGSLARYGWNRKRYSFERIFATIGLGITVVVGSLAVVFLAGNVLHLPGFGEVIIEPSRNLLNSFEPEIWVKHRYHMDVLSVFTDRFSPQGMPATFIYMIVIFSLIAIAAGLTFNLLFTLGEEMAWRGFLVAETRSMGFVGASFITGLMSGIYALGFVAGVSGGAVLTQFPTMMGILGYHVAGAFLLTWLSVKFRSVYASASLVGIINNLAGVTYIFIYDGDPLFNGVKGVAGITIFLLAALVIILRDKRFIEQYETYRF